MIIIGVDFHPAYQEIASVNTEIGEYQEKRLAHAQEAEEFYRCLACVGQTVRVGMEASGQAQWLERLLEGLGVELWRGDAEVIRAKRGRKQKTDREDARHILKLLLKDDFPRIWVPNWENRDLRQLLWHRHRMMKEYQDFTKSINESGHWRASSQLHPVSKATTVRIRDGKKMVTDGPFAETKEQLGGFYLVEAKDLDEAVALAARVPSARFGSIEVRPLVGRNRP